VTLATFTFGKKFRDHVGTVPKSQRAKFEVRNFGHFGANSIYCPTILLPNIVRCHVTWPCPLFEKISFISGLYLGAYVPFDIHSWRPPRDVV